METGNKHIKNYILSVFSTVLSLVFPIITFPYVARILGTNNLGIVNFVQSYGYYFIHFASFGISSYAVREVSKVRNDKDALDKIGNEIFNINAFFSVASFILYVLGVAVVPQFRVNWVTFLVYSPIVITNFLTLEWLFQSFDDYLFTTIRSSIIRILSLVAVFVLVRTKEDYIIYMVITTISEMGARFSTLMYGRKTYLRLRMKRSFLNMKAHIQPLFTLFIFRFVNGISANLDKLMIGFFMVYEAVGIYSAGVKFMLMLVPIVETAGIVLFPTINIAANSKKEDYIRVLNLNYDIILFLALPMTVGIFLVSPKLIVLFAGAEYTGAVSIARIMAVIILLSPIGDLLGSKILLVFNKDKQLLSCSSIVAVSNIVLNFIFIPLWGIAGAAIASVLCYLISICTRYYYSKKLVDFKLITKSFWRYLGYTVPFIIVYAIFYERVDNSLPVFIIFILFCMAVYGVEILVFKDKIGMMLIEKLRKKGA